MNSSLRMAVMVALVLSLVATSATAMVTKHGPTPLVSLKANVTRIDQRALVWCTRDCTNMHKLAVDTCNAMGSAFRSMRLRNATAGQALAFASIGKCVSSATNTLRDCKAKCTASSKKQF